MITREASNRLSPRALAGWRRALLLLPMALGAPGCAEGAERARTVAALCGGEGEACCPEPDVPCGIQLACDASRTCRLEVLSPGANRLCQSGRDCSAGQTCCEAGNFGTCLPVLPGECPAPDLELVYDPTYVSPANEGLGFSGAFPPGLSVVRRIVDSQRNGDNIDGSLPLVAPPAAAFRSCAAEKQCVAGPGLRTLMLFSIRVYNAGDADLILGPAGAPGVQPAACDSASYSTPEASRQPVRSPPYRERYLLYQLLDEAGTPRVQSYGLAPAVTCLPAVQSTSRFSCEFLGLQQGEMEI
ncbi:MAG TPA: hypothetical protein VNN80_17570, partial [Polyangiaceae bacterium]|nr:hypothetical protein [Polyangiaceae bacterium]